ncbi:hypothetical protein QMI71_004755 [Salmonella enterica]|nr:hypothetical protein [Salmonella enterica]ELW2866330.1 hypothetical protein [Salmonella enterica]
MSIKNKFLQVKNLFKFKAFILPRIAISERLRVLVLRTRDPEMRGKA